MRWSQKARLAALPNELLSINFRSSQRAEVELRMTKGILLVAAAGPMSHTDLELKKSHSRYINFDGKMDRTEKVTETLVVCVLINNHGQI